MDRVIELGGQFTERIRKEGYAWFVDDDNDDYLARHTIMVAKEEANDYEQAAKACYKMYETALQYVQKNDLWERLGLPKSILPLIKLDLERQIPHICGRFDFAGGIESIPLKLLEFNADTCTNLPETAFFQKWIKEEEDLHFKNQVNYLLPDLAQAFRRLKSQFPDKLPLLLLCSLGYPEDQLNLKVIQQAAESAGFEVDYADLEDVVFSDDGVFLEDEEEGFVQYPFMYKLVPWEFIIFEEPELLEILTDLAIYKDLIILNPSYTIAMQAKHMLSILYELYPDSPYLLPTFDQAQVLQNEKHVQKVNFGRQGENIEIRDQWGDVLAQTDGDFGAFSKVYQEFAEMYSDEDGDIYQAGVFVCDKRVSALSFRSSDGLIIDDDAEFVSHVLLG